MAWDSKSTPDGQSSSGDSSSLRDLEGFEEEFTPHPTIKDAYFWHPKWTPEEEKEIAAGVDEMRLNPSLLKTIRDRLNLTQDEMAAILGVSQSSVSKLEAKTEPPMKALRRLVEHRGGKLKLVIEFEGEDLEWPFQ